MSTHTLTRPGIDPAPPAAQPHRRRSRLYAKEHRIALLFVAVDVAVTLVLSADARRRGRWHGYAVWLAAPLLLGPILYGRYDSLPTFFALTGLYCPGCGSTRCLHALAQLDVAGAMAMNPLLVLSLLPLAVLVLHGAGLLPQRLLPLRNALAAPKLWLVLLLGFAFLRNLPWAPFTLLAPG